MKSLLILGMLMITIPNVATAQTFSSGSTGADGALDLSSSTCSTCTLQLPDSGVFNFTTVNIPSGKTLQFSKNLRNTPVIILAQGAVTIAGLVMLSAPGRSGGPGGFDGGNAGSGFGPGGGTSTDKNGKWIGPVSLVPIVGGSGGWGGGAGGGGGGAIVIASSTSITIPSNGSISANGSGALSSGAGGGSGGAIRLIANSISIAGGLSAFTSTVSAGNQGTIRIESPSGSFTGTGFPTPVLSTTINPEIIPSGTTPSLVFTSIAGFAVPAAPAARSDLADLMLPAQLADPIAIVVHGHNIPVGTMVNVSIGSNDVSLKSPGTVTTGVLSGSFDSSTATLNISGMSRTAVSTLFILATFNPSATVQGFNPSGLNHVAKIRIESGVNGRSKIAFLRRNGTEINQGKLPVAFVKQFLP